MRPKLILVAGKADKAEIRLKLPTIVGRTREAGLMIGHKTVSRRHCELFERHGMLFVRDTGSRNGTLVDDVPIKESMLKPGHTLTIGPLTFRADYEPADAFIHGDDSASPNGAAALTTPNTDVLDAAPDKSATPPPMKKTALLTETSPAEELEFEDLESHDALDLDLPLPADDDLTVDAAVDKVDSSATVESAAELDDALMLDDDAGLSFDEVTDTAPAAVLPPSGLESVPLESADDGAASPVGDDLAELGSSDDLLSFDLDDEPSFTATKDALPEVALDDDNLGFEIKDELPSSNGSSANGAASANGAPSTSGAESEMDDLGFTLEDLEATPAPVLEESHAVETNGEEEALDFEIAEPEPPKAAAGKATASKASAGKASAKNGEGGAKVPLGEERASGADSEMSRFMKELGL